MEPRRDRRNINNMGTALAQIALEARKESSRSKSRSKPGYGSLDPLTWKPTNVRSENDLLASILSWRQNATALSLQLDSRVLCQSCGGSAVRAPWHEIAGCFACHDSQDGPCEAHQEMGRRLGCKTCQDGPRPCPRHACAICGGSGLVCPTCRGMRFLRLEWPDRHDGFPYLACPKCIADGQVSTLKEHRLIQQYLARHPEDRKEKTA